MDEARFATAPNTMFARQTTELEAISLTKPLDLDGGKEVG
jgi:hypothetical protein